MSITPGYVAFKLIYQVSPIFLTGGIAQGIPGGMLPIVALTEAINFLDGLLSGPADIDLDNVFATFEPMPGATILDQKIGTYPFATQQIAANAIIVQPLHISMRMIAPARNTFAFGVKLATMLSLQSSLYKHNTSGGTYTVVTPSYIYTNCLMTQMRDTSASTTKQPQNTWELDFEQPLLTLQQAQPVQNSLMSRITSGLQTVQNLGTSAWSGAASTVGSLSSLTTASVIPAAANVTGGVTSAPIAASTPTSSVVGGFGN